MRVVLLIAFILLVVAAASPADAAVVYERTATEDIVIAGNDGSGARVIAHGTHPLISPDGRHVAFFRPGSQGDALRVIGSNGKHLETFRGRVFAPSPGAPYAWSPNGRYLAATSFDRSGGYIYDRRTRARRFISCELKMTGAAFSPDSHGLIIENESDRDVSLDLIRLGHRGRRTFARSGAFVTWGGQGIAYNHRRSILSRPTPTGRDRALYAVSRSVRDMYNVAWAGNGLALLAAQGPSLTDLQAVVIRPSTHRVQVLPAHLTNVASLSRDGGTVLGEANGDVVAERPDGTIAVLAAGATSPSWTR